MKQQHEKGQVIVLIAAIMIGLIAMLGLAIDGGGMFFLKRDLQNATDAAIIAATYAKCSGGTAAQVENAALEAAEKNGFVRGTDANGNLTTITVLQGPPTGVVVSNPDDYVRVSISSEKTKYFIQIVYSGDMEVVAKATGKCNRLYVSENQRAIFASGTCSGGCSLNITGSTDTVIGGTHSNGCTSVPIDHTIPPPNSSSEPNPPRTINPPPVDVPPVPMPIIYRTSEFDSATDFFPSRAGTNYYRITGDVTLPSASAGANKVTDSQMRTALIYVNGNVTLRPNDMNFALYRITLVTTGEIKSTNLDGKTMSSYLNVVMGDPQYSLLMFSDKSTSGCNASSAAIDISPNDGNFNGMFYVPYAGFKIRGSNLRIIGAIWARFVDANFSNSYVEYNPNGIPISRTTISLPSD